MGEAGRSALDFPFAHGQDGSDPRWQVLVQLAVLDGPLDPFLCCHAWDPRRCACLCTEVPRLEGLDSFLGSISLREDGLFSGHLIWARHALAVDRPFILFEAMAVRLLPKADLDAPSGTSVPTGALVATRYQRHTLDCCFLISLLLWYDQQPYGLHYNVLRQSTMLCDLLF